VNRPIKGLFWPSIAILLVSAASMALEIIAGRALAPYVGMSLYTWTLIIAVVLAGLSLGNWIGGLLADRTDRPERIVAIGLIAAALTTLASLYLLKAAAGWVDEGEPIQTIAILSMTAFFAPSAFAGALSPPLTIIALRNVGEERRGGVLGLMFALGALGAILGTLIAGFVLISYLGTGYSVIAIAALYAVLSLRFWYAGRGIAASLVALLMVGGGAAYPQVLHLSNSCDEESRYFCIRVDDFGDGARPMRIMALDHLVHGVNDKADPQLLWSPYVHGVDELIAARFPGDQLSAFFVGGGAYTLPRAWAARYPEGAFTIAELDPEVTEQARRALWFAPDQRTILLHGDARRLLQAMPPTAKFDVVFGDAFHDIAIPQHLVTDEFHAEVAKRLRPKGVYALNVVDGLRQPRFLISLATTLQAQFAHVELWLDIEAVQPQDARTTWIVLASDQPTGVRQFSATRGFQRDWVQVPLEDMKRVVGDDQVIFLSDDFAPVDRLLAQVSSD